MSEEKTNFNYQSIGNQSTSFCSMLTILFIGLKLANVINWSWWWVLSPIWIPVTFGVFVLIFCAIIFYIVGKFEKD